MTVWFRKNVRVIMVAIVGFLAVAFLLPNLPTGNRNNSPNTVLGHYELNGAPVEIRMKDQMASARGLQYLRLLGFDRMYFPTENALVPVVSIGEMSQSLGQVGRVPAMAVNALLFGEAQVNRQLRSAIVRQTLQTSPSEEVLEGLTAKVNGIVDNNTLDAALAFTLLSEEAKGMGITATRQQVDAMLDMRGQLMAMNMVQPVPIGSIIQQMNGTQEELRKAVGDYIAILRSVAMLSSGMIVSEPELRKAVRDMVQMETVSGEFVTFETDLFMDKTDEPSEEEIAAQFEAYKDYDAEVVTEDNPFGFGYKLPDRVKAGYVSLDLKAISKEVKDELNEKSLVEQEELFKEFYTNHPQLFQRQIPETDDTAGGQEQWELAPFDDVVMQARDFYIENEALERGQKRIAEIMETAGAADELGALAEESKGSMKLSYGETGYLNRRELAEHPDFSNTYLMNGTNATGMAVMMLFQSKPLVDAEDITRFDIPPMEVGQLYGPFVSFDQSQKPSKAYVMKLIGADKSRVASSWKDDGRNGATGGADSTLRDEIAADIREQQAYAMAKEWASRFSTEAADNWDIALENMNKVLKDPCSPMNPLIADKLEDIRNQNRQLQQMMSQLGGSMQQYLARNAVLLRKAMEHFQENGGDGATLPLVEDKQYGRCMVFKSLWAPQPSQEEYLDRRPLVAQSLETRQLTLHSLDYLYPENILARMKFQYEREASAADSEQGMGDESKAEGETESAGASEDTAGAEPTAAQE